MNVPNQLTNILFFFLFLIYLINRNILKIKRKIHIYLCEKNDKFNWKKLWPLIQLIWIWNDIHLKNGKVASIYLFDNSLTGKIP